MDLGISRVARAFGQGLKGGLLLLALGLSLCVADPLPSSAPLSLAEADGPIRVDGHLGDWPSARMFVLDRASQVVEGRFFWKGPEDLNARVFVTYDPQYLFLSALVEKKGRTVNENRGQSLWNGDCLELFLSTSPGTGSGNRLSAGDFHIGFSPGTDGKDPQIFCFNRDSQVPGGRIIARTTPSGYLMEACVPLSFFSGLRLGPGKEAALDLALDLGGAVSGNRLVQMDLGRDPKAKERPSGWQPVQWAGAAELEVPQEGPAKDYDAGSVADGTQGALFRGLRTVRGLVLDGKGVPLPGARVGTWPKTREAVSGADGTFEIEKARVYDRTLLTARTAGTSGSLAPLPPKAGAVTLRLRPLPGWLSGEPGVLGPLFFGTVSGDGDFPKGAKAVRLAAPAPGQALEKERLDHFLSQAKTLGVVPLVSVPWDHRDPAGAADWVRYCNLERGYGVRYWAYGDEPERSAGGPGGLTVYDYVNDLRTAANAMKALDPSILVMGPETAEGPMEGRDDWLGPVLRYDGDVLDIVSIHGYSSLSAADFTADKAWADIRSGAAFLRNLYDRVAGSLPGPVPLLVTGGAGWREGEGAEDPFWEALWTAEAYGAALSQGLPMRLFTPRALEKGKGPMDQVLGLLGLIPPGKRLNARIGRDDVSVQAVQGPSDRDLALLLVNKGDRFYRPKIRLDGKEGDLVVDAGSDLRVDFEVPSRSVAVLRIKLDRSPGEAFLYTKKMFEAGEGPKNSVLKPW